VSNTPAVSVALALNEAERTAHTVTVHVDGHAPETGTVVAHPTLPHGYWQLRPLAGRALSFHSLDVTEVIFE
jgi:hypothetical protein